MMTRPLSSSSRSRLNDPRMWLIVLLVFSVVLIFIQNSFLIARLESGANSISSLLESFAQGVSSFPVPGKNVSRRPHQNEQTIDAMAQLSGLPREEIEGKMPLIRLLEDAKENITELLADTETMRALPLWSEVVDMFGEESRVLGLETCQQFAKSRQLKNTTRFHIGIAGTFNSGTNLAQHSFSTNCLLPENRIGLIDWGKHTPLSGRDIVSKSRRIRWNFDASFPIVMTRDPYTWMSSMCRQPYGARFHHSKEHCPNLIPTEEDKRMHGNLKKLNYTPIFVTYDAKNGLKRKHESLAHMYNEWYSEYINSTSPRLFVRTEDLVFRPKETLHKVCSCFGGTVRPALKVMSTDVKKRMADIGTRQTSLLKALISYGHRAGRREGYEQNPNQLNAARDILDPNVMDYFGYSYEDEDVAII